MNGSANRRRHQPEGAPHAGESRSVRKQQTNPASTTRIRFHKVSAFLDSFLTSRGSPENEGRTELSKPKLRPRAYKVIDTSLFFFFQVYYVIMQAYSANWRNPISF